MQHAAWNLEYMLDFFGVNADVVRIEPPLTISKEQAEVVIQTIQKVANEVLNNDIPEETKTNANKYSIGI